MSEWLKETGCKPVGIAYSGSNPLAPTIAGVAQLVEHRPSKPRVASSNLVSRFFILFCFVLIFIVCPCGSVVEHTLGKGEVTGSNPVMGFCLSILFVIGGKTMIS